MDTSTAVPFNALLTSSAARDGVDAPSRAIERELAQLRARVRELSAELVDAQESVRRHVARELHDGVGAELTATRFALAGIETWLPADAPSQCTAALAVVSRSLDAVCAANREAVAQLHAPSFEMGVAAALRHWSRDFAARTGLHTSFGCSDDARLARLSADAALAVFRVAQEALNNVAKHARASCVDVRIEAGTRHLKLFVSDDGIGMPRGGHKKNRSQHGGHFGLAGMQARCVAFDGTLRVSARRASVNRAVEANDATASASGTSPRGTLIQARFGWDALLAPVSTVRASRRALQS
ncbi:sensor histidine kinase [Paraburkholderia antibiotica]|uniref:histidine kinase n=1 Tax=Paraburkholderia antibiotica TaxID=2728839 RepID=A0A7X9X8C6_9BURK|nr:ATP-binding protein [Paraburkholderia antibiotica]NML33388.1 histidine kinase [Paraburkholderia antibiotica]